MVGITVNGQPREVPAGASLEEMICHLGLGEGRLALERNLELVPRAQWATVRVEAGDRFEIVHFVGGGRA